MLACGTTCSDSVDLTHLVEDHKIKQEDITLPPSSPVRKPLRPPAFPSLIQWPGNGDRFVLVNGHRMGLELVRDDERARWCELMGI